MNERMKELAEQAALLGPTSRVGNAHEAAERFAVVTPSARNRPEVTNGNIEGMPPI